MNLEKGLLTTTEVAKIFGVTKSAVNYWTLEKPPRIPCIRIPGAKRDVIRFEYDVVMNKFREWKNTGEAKRKGVRMFGLFKNRLR